MASLKRWIEIKKATETKIPGRGYINSDYEFVSKISYFSGILSILVICLYIDSQEAKIIYSSPEVLWIIPLILFYWVIETLFKVERGLVDDDPVLFAIKSKTSYVSLICFGFILYFAKYL